MTVSREVLLLLVLGWMVAGVATCAVLYRQLTKLERDLHDAQDRLLAAWKDGMVVPPRASGFEAAAVLPPLPAELKAFVEAWESPASRMAEEARIRKWLDDGWKPERIAKHLSDPPPDTT